MSNSDYSKPRTNLIDLLPEVLQSDFSKVLLENGMNRFLTKSELLRVIGFIGQGNPNAIIDRQVKEPNSDPHRQAFQLQPLIYDKIGTIEHISNSRDIYNELKRLGVDIDRLPVWGDATSFNWTPPIDFDKLLNFRDYYWVNPDDLTSRPQYFTIQNPCSRAMSKASEYDRTLNEFGETHTITGLSADGSPLSYKFTIPGNLSPIFTNGFVFFVKNSTNTSINSTFFTTTSSIFDASINSTIITVSQPFTDITTISGIISLIELKDIFDAEVTCICFGSVGWDGGPWDDNQTGSIIWNEQLLLDITFSTDADWITNNGGASPSLQDIWYDTSTDTLKQYSIDGPLDPSPLAYDVTKWKVVQSAFSNILAITTGDNFWDFSENCGFETNAWINENKWTHKNQVTNFATAKRANVPIIEYLPTVRLNEWSRNVHKWKYRKDDLNPFTLLPDFEIPNLFELVGINHPDNSTFFGGFTISNSTTIGSPVVLDQIIINERYGDLTKVFIPGYQFKIQGSLPMGSPTSTLNDGIYTVATAIYCNLTGGSPVIPGHYQTIITITSAFPNNDNTGFLLPVQTSRGDNYLELHKHWVYAGFKESTPECHKPENVMLPITTPFGMDAGFMGSPPLNRWQERTGIYAQEWTFIVDAFAEHTLVGINSSLGSMTFTGNHASDLTQLTNPAFISDTSLQLLGNLDQPSNGNYKILSIADVGFNTVVTVDPSTPIPATIDTTSGRIFFNWRLDFDCNIIERSKLGAFEIRVYVDDERQFGTYTESNNNNFISLGGPTCSPTIFAPDFVNSIVINRAIPNFSTIRVEVGAASASCIGLEYVHLRTEENDALFNPNPGFTNGFAPFNITQFLKLEQIKEPGANQYPLFDMYDIEGDCLNFVSSIFKYRELQTAPVDFNTGRRIVVLSADTNWEFEQFLVESDNGVLRTYRDNSKQTDFWFDCDNNILYRWTGETWDKKVLTISGHYIDMIVSRNVPALNPFGNINGMIWWNTGNNTINVSDGAGTWVMNAIFTANTTINKTDPTIISVWRTGPETAICSNKEEYIPAYVDANRNPITIGNSAGDWEFPDQLFFNPSHENRKIISLTGLVNHFNSVIDSQAPLPGFFGNNRTLWHIRNDINYGLGGSIKEFNDSYDTFISSVFVKNVNPLTLYEFAHDAYENALNILKELFRQDLVKFMTDVTQTGLANISDNIKTAIITAYEQNDATSIVYGDSNTFNPTTGLGVRNWPATLPFVRLGFKVEPQQFYDPEQEFNEIRFHDGHLDHISFSETSLKAFILRIIGATDARTTNTTGKFGKQSSNLPPELFVDYDVTEGFGKTTGIYWFQNFGTVSVLYRMNALAVSPLQPNPALFNDGEYWYDTSVNLLMIISGGIWIQDPTLGTPVTAFGKLADFGIGYSGAWEVVDLNKIMSDIIFEVETRLFQVAPNLNELSFDFASLNNEQVLQDTLTEGEFGRFIAQSEIRMPFENEDFDATDPFTWNYVDSIPITPFTDVNYVAGGTWEDVYQKRYGTPYPNFEPWVLQGYPTKPTWWDATYPADPGRRWSVAMWMAVLGGFVPAGEALPNGNIAVGFPAVEVQNYNFVSVNIDSITHDGFEPDDILPPFWAPVSGTPANVRSLFTTSTEIINEDSVFEFGDAGVVEWDWRNSSQFLYDQLKVAFKMQPVRFIHSSIGEEYVDVDCLQVSRRTQKVYSHKDALFHGDLLSDNSILQFQGSLQWYVNFNRFSGFDTSHSDFRDMWTKWFVRLGYQFGSFIDSESFLLSNSGFDIVNQDYFITSKRSPGIEDHWLDAFNVVIVQTPPSLLAKDTESDWVFEVETFSPIGRTITYFGSKRFTYTVNPTTDEFTSTDPRIPTWVDGSEVIFITSSNIPGGLAPNKVYFIQKTGTFTFKVSETQTGGLPVNITSAGIGVQEVGEVKSTFQALGGKTTDRIWYNLELDKTQILTFVPPKRITGIQNMIDIINGYASYEEDVENFTFNQTSTDQDFDTNRPINWQLEIERFVDFAFSIRTTRHTKKDTNAFEISDLSTDTLIFKQNINPNTNQPIGSNPTWGTGTRVIASGDNTLPAPLLQNSFYYVIRIDANTFKLAISSRNSKNNIAIDITTNGIGNFFVRESDSIVNNPVHEINPFRHNVRLKHPMGVLADVLKGPFFDVKTEPAILDQNKKGLALKDTFLFREDKLSRINIKQGISNDLLPINNNPYFDLHATSAHLFLDGYEHIIIFNNYSFDGALIYDPFFGVNTSKFDVLFDKSPEFNLRPNLGGYVISNPQPGEENNGTSMTRNIEGQVEDLRNAFDTFRSLESNILTEHTRDTLGYDGTQDFLDLLNVNPKSQFIFWRGMIQNKGSINAINAFINSRRFVDAKVDEYWAFKIADYGDSKELSLPEMNLFEADAKKSDLKVEFTYVQAGPQNVDDNFENVNDTSEIRWFERPDQQEFFTSNKTMFFNSDVVQKQTIISSDLIQPTVLDGFDYVELIDTCYDLKVFDDMGVQIPEVGIAPSSGQFQKVNANGIRFITGEGLNYTIWYICPHESKLNPGKIRDNKNEFTFSLLPIFDPARNYHYHNAIHLVDIQKTTDPAIYTDLLIGSPAIDNDPLWGRKRVGTIWMDTNVLGFQPYYDEVTYPSIDDRLQRWGRLAEWSEYKLYQWTETELTIDEYNTIASAEELNEDIPDSKKRTGRIKRNIERLASFASAGNDTTYQPMNFVKVDLINYKFYDETAVRAVFDYPAAGGSSSIGDDGINFDEPASVYINGIITPAGDFVDYTELGTYITTDGLANGDFTENDALTIVRFLPLPDEVPFPTTQEQPGIRYRFNIPFTSLTIQENGNPVVKNYFWVEKKTIIQTDLGHNISMASAVNQLENIPIPYMVIQKFQNAVNDGGSPVSKELLPDRYVQTIIRGLNSIVNEDNRYVVRFTRNFILRDNLDDGNTPLDLKTAHEEWLMFRQEQQFNIERVLWNKVIESVIGEEIVSNPSGIGFMPSGVRVPSLSRELFDITNKTETRFGLNSGQSFADGDLAWNTILSYLKSPLNDFAPINIDDFFTLHDINNLVPTVDKQATVDMLNAIYETFLFTNINRIFFNVLLDALSTKARYRDLFKTSFISLFGIKILNVNGQFDD